MSTPDYSDPSIEAEVARHLGLGARILLAHLDRDEEQVAALVNADVNAAVRALIHTAEAAAHALHGFDRDVTRAAIAEVAIRAELTGVDDAAP